MVSKLLPVHNIITYYIISYNISNPINYMHTKACGSFNIRIIICKIFYCGPMGTRTLE